MISFVINGMLDPDSSRHAATPACDQSISGSRALLVAAFLISLVVAHAGANPATSTVDGRGKRIELAAPPRRIVSIAPSITEILFALGLSGKIVADTSQCDYP